MEKEKIFLTYQDEDELQIESVWAIKIGDNYKIDNVPFFANNIALADIVSTKQENDLLYVDKLIEPSSHSVVQIIFYNEEKINEVLAELVRAGCTWEGSHLESLTAIDIPPATDYKNIKKILDHLASEDILDYREACLGF